jgi:hypothetical protein
VFVDAEREVSHPVSPSSTELELVGDHDCGQSRVGGEASGKSKPDVRGQLGERAGFGFD